MKNVRLREVALWLLMRPENGEEVGWESGGLNPVMKEHETGRVALPRAMLVHGLWTWELAYPPEEEREFLAVSGEEIRLLSLVVDSVVLKGELEK